MPKYLIDLVGVEAITNLQHLKKFDWFITSHFQFSPQLIHNIFSIFNSNSIIDGDLNAHHFACDFSHHDHRGDILHSAISNVNLSLINAGFPARINRLFILIPPLTSLYVPQILFFFLTSFLLDNLYGSDHFPILIEHTGLLPISPNLSPNTNQDYSALYYIEDWLISFFFQFWLLA